LFLLLVLGVVFIGGATGLENPSVKSSQTFFLQEGELGVKRKAKKCPVERRGSLMFSQRNNPYCESLQIVIQIY